MKTDDEVEAVGSSYGHGLCIYLNDDQCEALGIKEPLPADGFYDNSDMS